MKVTRTTDFIEYGEDSLGRVNHEEEGRVGVKSVHVLSSQEWARSFLLPVLRNSLLLFGEKNARGGVRTQKTTVA